MVSLLAAMGGSSPSGVSDALGGLAGRSYRPGSKSNPEPRSEPAEGDYQALYARMRGLGADERLMKILGDEGRLMRAAPEDQCSIGVFLYEAMDQLPEDQSARLGAFLLSPA